MRTWQRTDVRVMQEMGNTLVALELINAFFCWANIVEDVESGCACGYCRHTRTIYSVSLWSKEGNYFEDEVDLSVSNRFHNRFDKDSF